MNSNDDDPRPVFGSKRSLSGWLAVVLAMVSAFSAAGQGWVYFANHVTATLDEPVSDCTGLLSGTGYTAQLFGGPAGTADNDLVPLTPVTTFRTDPAQAGAVVSISVIVPSVPAGQVARLQMRVWENRGGSISSWQAATNNPTVQRGMSDSFNSPPLTQANVQEPVILTGLRSFTICPVHLSLPQPAGNGVFSLVLTGVPGHAYAIESTTNLPNWSPLFTVTNVSTTVQFNVTNAPAAPGRFYRARETP